MKRFTSSCNGFVLLVVLATSPLAAQAANPAAQPARMGLVTGTTLSAIPGQPGLVRVVPPQGSQGSGSSGRQSTQGSRQSQGYTGGLPVFHDYYCEQYGC